VEYRGTEAVSGARGRFRFHLLTLLTASTLAAIFVGLNAVERQVERPDRPPYVVSWARGWPLAYSDRYDDYTMGKSYFHPGALAVDAGAALAGVLLGAALCEAWMRRRARVTS